MNRAWFIVLAFSIGLNGALLYDHFVRPQPPRPPHERFERGGQPPWMSDDRQRHGDSARREMSEQRIERRLERMMDALDLSAEQRGRIRAIHSDSFERILALRRETRAMRDEMHELLGSAALDSVRIRGLIHDLHEKQSQLEALIMDNLLHESAVLTPEQRVRYQEMMMGSGRGGRSRWRH